MKRTRIFFTSLAILLAGATLLADFAEARGRRRGRGRDTNQGPSEEVTRTTGGRPWYFYYTAAQDLEKSNNWKRAKDNYILAISADPEPDPKKRVTGRKFLQYFPYYRAARAYYYLGQVQEAEKYLRQAESKNVAPRDLVGELWQLIIDGRQTPQVFIYSIGNERTKQAFIDIKGIAFDYHNIEKITVSQGNYSVDAFIRDAELPDEVKTLPYEPRLGFDPIDTKYFESLAFPLNNYGENRIQLRAHASNPDRKSDLIEVTIFRDPPEEEKAFQIEQAPPPPAEDEMASEGEMTDEG